MLPILALREMKRPLFVQLDEVDSPGRGALGHELYFVQIGWLGARLGRVALLAPGARLGGHTESRVVDHVFAADSRMVVLGLGLLRDRARCHVRRFDFEELFGVRVLDALVRPIVRKPGVHRLSVSSVGRPLRPMEQPWRLRGRRPRTGTRSSWTSFC